jgi:hypothetical protein
MPAALRCESDIAAIPTGLIGWEISSSRGGAGAGRPSYIIGTIHSMYHPKYAFNQDIDVYMSSCEVFVMESKNSLFTSKNETDYFLPKDTDMKKLLGEEKWGKLCEACRKNSIDGKFNRYLPWYMAALLTRPEIRDKECSIMDQYLHDRALEKSMKIYCLETMVTSSLNKIPLEAQIEELEEIISSLDEIKTAETNIISAYNSGDVQKLSLIIGKNSTGQKRKIAENRVESILIDERNSIWLPLIEKHIDKGRCLIAVGAAHLIGKNSIIESLKNRGYAVKNISVPSSKFSGK